MDLGKPAKGDRRSTVPSSAVPNPTVPNPTVPNPAVPNPTVRQSDVPQPGVSRRAGHSWLGPGGVGGVPARPASVSGLVSLNVRYYALRAALFGGVLATLLVLGMDGLLAFALAVVVSGLVSFPLAIRQRRASVEAVEARRGGRR